MPERKEIKKEGMEPSNSCPHCTGSGDMPALDAAWLELTMGQRIALLKQLGYTFTLAELDFHGAGLPFLHELAVTETHRLERMVLGERMAKVVDVQRTVEERLDALIGEVEAHIFNTKVRKEEVLGVILAKYYRWDGQKILDIAYQALEDANFHAEAAKVDEIAKSLEYDMSAGNLAQRQEGGYDSQGWRNEGEVPSMSGQKVTYLVDSHISGRWRCTCPDYKIRRQYNGSECKHIRAVREAQQG